MNRNFVKSNFVSPDRLHALQRRSNRPGLRRFMTQVVLLLASGIGLTLGETWSVIAPSFFVNVVIQVAMFGMLHESCHQTAFKSRSLNLLAGWAAALAQPMSPALMRAFHFEHHRHTHELDRDPELGGLRFMLEWPRSLMLLMTLSGLPLWIARFGWTIFAALVPNLAVTDVLWSKVLPFIKPAKRRRVIWEARALLLIHAGLVTSAVLWFPSGLRYYLAMAVGHALLSVYVTCEHRGLPAHGSIFDRTRTIKVPAFIRWLLWNMPYHAEHHAWPAVPFHALGDLHREVRAHLIHHQSIASIYVRRGRTPSSDE